MHRIIISHYNIQYYPYVMLTFVVSGHRGAITCLQTVAMRHI